MKYRYLLAVVLLICVPVLAETETSTNATPNHNLSSKVTIPPSDEPEPAPSEERSTQFVSHSTDGDAQPAVSPSSPAVTKPSSDQTQQLSNVASEQAQSAGSGGTRAPILDADSLKLSYQAFLTDNNGVPLPGPTVNLKFFIYATGAGLVEGPIDANNVPISNGVVDATFAVSASSFDGSGRELGVTVNGGVELAPRAALVTVPYALRVDRVASAELDDTIALGDSTTTGQLDVYRTGTGTASISLFGNSGQISTYGGDGLEQIRLWGASWGELFLYDASVGNDMTVKLTATSNSGGELHLYDSGGGASILADGGSGSIEVEQDLAVVDTVGGANLIQLYKSTAGGLFRTYDENGVQTVQGGSGTVGGFLNLSRGGTTALGVRLDGDDAGAGLLQLSGSTGTNVVADADEGDGGALMTLSDGTRTTIDLDANAGGGGAGVVLTNSAGIDTIVLDADSTDHAYVTLRNASGENSIILQAQESTGGAQILLRNGSSSTTIELDANWGGSGEGRVRSSVIEVTGGSDLSEQFDVAGNAEPGMVVCLDTESAGKLVVSHRAYDRTVAGIISGANGIKTGLLMGQFDSLVNGKHAVALTGRVFCLAVEESDDPIRIGDLLTTSNAHGRCMKVKDYGRAQGAIIGKAMSRMDDGMVLVLVSLQ